MSGNLKGTSFDEVMKELKRASESDYHFADGRVLGSMCTEPLDIAKEAHCMFLEANLGNPGLYPGTVELENTLIAMVSELLHGKGAMGLTVGGGTEANITALWIAKKASGGSEVIFPQSAHFSFWKAADILGLEPIEVGLTEDLTVDVDEVARRLSPKTACVVAIAGATEFGVIDPISELGDSVGDTYLHVDAAFGGFVIPFLKDLGHDMPSFDLEVEGVDFISTDPHKMGMATIPCGVLLLRDSELLDKIAVNSPYLTNPRQASLAGTRCSAGAVSAYAAMKYLGREGYSKVVGGCMETTGYLVDKCTALGLEIALKPIMPIVTIRMKDPKKVQARLYEMGWKPSVTRSPKCLRVVVMPHVTRKIVDEFIPDLGKVCRELGEI